MVKRGLCVLTIHHTVTTVKLAVSSRMGCTAAVPTHRLCAAVIKSTAALMATCAMTVDSCAPKARLQCHLLASSSPSIFLRLVFVLMEEHPVVRDRLVASRSMEVTLVVPTQWLRAAATCYTVVRRVSGATALDNCVTKVLSQCHLLSSSNLPNSL